MVAGDWLTGWRVCAKRRYSTTVCSFRSPEYREAVSKESCRPKLVTPLVPMSLTRLWDHQIVEMMRNRGRLLLVLLLSAGLASVLSTVLAHQASRAAGRDSPMWLLGLLNSTFWYGWAFLALALMALTNR